jgi:hypothetical protein
MSVDGMYYLSTYKNSVTRKFGSPERSSVKSINLTNKLNMTQQTAATNTNNMGTPGPGSYRILSEFGKYEWKDLSKINEQI